MPQETVLARCGHCGAPLAPSADRVVFACAYCGTRSYLGASPDRTYHGPDDPPPADAPRRPVRAFDDAPLGLHARLLRGPLGRTVGTAERINPPTLHQRDATRRARAVWPRHAEASSTYGAGWAPAAMLGPPRVFPRSGDIAGAWAPGPRHSPVEWVELEFDADAPVHAVRVLETHQAGSVFAIVDATTDDEDLLYAADPAHRAGAWALEVTLSPPRHVRRVRVYVVNHGWAELDTVGLLVDAATPLGSQPGAPRPRSALGLVLGLVAVGFAAVVGLVVATGSRSVPAAVQHAPQPAVSVAGATMQFTAPSLDDLSHRKTLWASEVTGFSSQYSAARNAAGGVVGVPDVYPRTGDLDGAWAPLATDGGHEWITVQFPSPTVATAVVWAETFHPGAVVRVEDLSNPSTPLTLWDGTPTAAPTGATIAEVRLAAPRPVTALRLTLNTRLVPGWNEIDAIGLIPAQH